MSVITDTKAALAAAKQAEVEAFNDYSAMIRRGCTYGTTASMSDDEKADIMAENLKAFEISEEKLQAARQLVKNIAQELKKPLEAALKTAKQAEAAALKDCNDIIRRAHYVPFDSLSEAEKSAIAMEFLEKYEISEEKLQLVRRLVKIAEQELKKLSDASSDSIVGGL
jgi:hypothetical protein